jgi:hypothetical protein
MSFESVEQKLQLGIQSKVEHLENCPVESYEAFLRLCREGKARLHTAPDPFMVQQLGDTADRVAHMALTWAGIPVAVILVALAWAYKTPMMMLGIPCALLAFVVRPPASVMRHRYALLLVGIVAFTVTLFVYVPVAGMIAAYLFTEAMTLIAISMNDRLFRQAAAHSEVLFIYLYSRRLLCLDLLDEADASAEAENGADAAADRDS